MTKFEIIVKDEKEALRLKLPEEVVKRIETINSINEDKFKEVNNEIILKVIIRYMDELLYGFRFLNPMKRKT